MKLSQNIWQGKFKTTKLIFIIKKTIFSIGVVDKFGTDARSISRTLENIKDPEQVEKAVQTENVEKFVERNKQLKN